MRQYAIKKPTVLLRWVFDFQNLKLSDDSEGLESVTNACHEASASTNAVLLEHVSTDGCALAQSVVRAQAHFGVSCSSSRLVFGKTSQQSHSTHWHRSSVASDVSSCSTCSTLCLSIEHSQFSYAQVVASADGSTFTSNVGDSRCTANHVSSNVSAVFRLQELDSQWAVSVSQVQHCALVSTCRN